MKLRTVLVVALAMLPVLAFAQTKKKKPSTPAIFGTAKYVYVRAQDGDLYNPRLLPEDRDAISNVMNALQAWGRYTVLPSADGAELIFIVRKGRIVSAQAGATVGTPGSGPYQRGPGPGSPGGAATGAPGMGTEASGGNIPGYGVGAEAGPPDDFMEVCMKQPGGDLSGPVWEHTMSDGLNSPDVRLISQLKKAVEKDYPQK
jgi:hypothetical protein